MSKIIKSGMTVWAVTTTHDASALTKADRVAPRLPDHLARLAAATAPNRNPAALAA